MKLVCVQCALELRPVKNGVASVESSSFGPYRLWSSDRWGCPQCGLEVLAGFGHEAIAEHYQPNFADTVGRFSPELTFFGSPEERQQYMR